MRAKLKEMGIESEDYENRYKNREIENSCRFGFRMTRKVFKSFKVTKDYRKNKKNINCKCNVKLVRNGVLKFLINC